MFPLVTYLALTGMRFLKQLAAIIDFFTWSCDFSLVRWWMHSLPKVLTDLPRSRQWFCNQKISEMKEPLVVTLRKLCPACKTGPFFNIKFFFIFFFFRFIFDLLIMFSTHHTYTLARPPFIFQANMGSLSQFIDQSNFFSRDF